MLTRLLTALFPKEYAQVIGLVRRDTPSAGGAEAGQLAAASANENGSLWVAIDGEGIDLGDVTIDNVTVSGSAAHDAAGAAVNPVAIGGYASAAAPTNVSADGDIVRQWLLRSGALVVQLSSSGTLVAPATEATLAARIPANGQAAMAASVPVVIASNQSAVAVTDAALSVTAPVGGEVASADTSAHAFGSQAVKAPVSFQIDKGMAGTLTLTATTGGAVLAILEWDDTDKHHNPSCVLNVANMNQITYQFSTNAGTEKFRYNSAS